MMFGLSPLALLIGLCLIIGAAGVGYYKGSQIEKLECENAAAKQKDEAAAQLLAATNRAHDVETRLAALNLQSETTHAKHQQEQDEAKHALADMGKALDAERSRRRAAERLAAQRLLDAGSGNGGNGTVPGNANAATVPAAGASPDAGADPGSFQVLVGLASDTIDVAEYARQCHDWVTSIGTGDAGKPAGGATVK